jgi:hypothetical protein
VVQHIPEMVIALENERQRQDVQHGKDLGQVRHRQCGERDGPVPDVLHVVPCVTELPGVVHLDGDLSVSQLIHPAGEEFGCVAHWVSRLMDGGELKGHCSKSRHREGQKNKDHNDSKGSFFHFVSSRFRGLLPRFTSASIV